MAKRKPEIKNRKGEEAAKPQAEEKAPAKIPHQLGSAGARPPSPLPAPAGNAGKNATADQDKWEKNPIDTRRLYRAEVISMVFLTLCLVGVTIWQTSVMVEQNILLREQIDQSKDAVGRAEKSAKESAKSAERTAMESAADSQRMQTLIHESSKKLLRAYISVKPLEVADAKQPDKLKISVTISNSGLTRAHSINASMGWTFSPANYAGPFDRDVQSPVRSWLGPDDIMRHDFFIDVTPTQRESTKAGKEVLWIYGIVHYVDDYDQKRCTDYRYYYDWQQEAFIYANEGNMADDCSEEERNLRANPTPADAET